MAARWGGSLSRAGSQRETAVGGSRPTIPARPEPHQPHGEARGVPRRAAALHTFWKAVAAAMAHQTNDRGGTDSGSRWQATAGVALDRLLKSGFMHRAGEFAREEMVRWLSGQQPSTKLTTKSAMDLSNNLNYLLANLINECKEEHRKLKGGGMFSLRGHELSAHDVETAVAALTALAFHFSSEMMDHLHRARRYGSVVAGQFIPQEAAGEQTPGTPSSGSRTAGLQASDPQALLGLGIGGQGFVSSLALPPERLRLIAERLRSTYEYAIKFATDIQQDIAGTHGASPPAHEKALNKAIMLTQRVHYAAIEILQLLNPMVDARSLSDGVAQGHVLPEENGWR